MDFANAAARELAIAVDTAKLTLPPVLASTHGDPDALVEAIRAKLVAKEPGAVVPPFAGSSEPDATTLPLPTVASRRLRLVSHGETEQSKDHRGAFSDEINNGNADR